MKTREQIIEDFFRARGFFHVDEHGEEYFYDPNNKSRLMPGHIYFFYPLDKHFDLFQKHVIEVMAERGFSPYFCRRTVEGKTSIFRGNILAKKGALVGFR